MGQKVQELPENFQKMLLNQPLLGSAWLSPAVQPGVSCGRPLSQQDLTHLECVGSQQPASGKEAEEWVTSTRRSLRVVLGLSGMEKESTEPEGWLVVGARGPTAFVTRRRWDMGNSRSSWLLLAW